MKALALAVTAALTSLALGLPSGAAAQERTVKVAGMGAKSGVWVVRRQQRAAISPRPTDSRPAASSSATAPAARS